MGVRKGSSIMQQKILAWLRANHPTEWVQLGGVNLQVAQGLVRQGHAEIRENPRGQHQIRLRPEDSL